MGAQLDHQARKDPTGHEQRAKPLCGRTEASAGTSLGGRMALGMQVRTFRVQSFPHPPQLLSGMESQILSRYLPPGAHRAAAPCWQGMMELPSSHQMGWAAPGCPRTPENHGRQDFTLPRPVWGQGCVQRGWDREVPLQIPALQACVCAFSCCSHSAFWECCFILALDPANWACTQAKQADMKLWSSGGLS